MLAEILNLYQQKQYRKIIKAVDSTNSNPKLLELKGISALKLSDFLSAYQTFKKLCDIASVPKNHYHLGLSSMQLLRHEEAIVSFEISKKDKKLQIASALNQSHCLFQVNKSVESINILLEMTQSKPDLKQAWSMLLLQLRDKSRVELLEKIIRRSQAIIGNTVEWKKANVYLWFNQQYYEKTIKGIENFKLENNEHFKMFKAKAYSKLNQFNRALELYKEILNNNNTAINHYNMAAAYSKLTSKEDLHQSLTYADSCLALDRNYHLAYYCKSLAYQKLGSLNSTLKVIDKALTIESDNLDYLYLKAETLKNTAKPKECLIILDKILTIDGNFNKALRLKGIVQLQLNQKSQAEETLSQTINLDNTDQRAIAYYAITKIAQNKVKEVEEFLGLGHFVKTFTFNPVPDYKDINAFNRAIENDIKQHSLLRKNPNGLAARNGYLTDDIFTDNTLSIQIYRKLLLEKIQQYIEQLPTDMNHHMLRHKTQDYEINSWATWVKGDGYIDKHIHEESWISGAYYCKVPKITETSETKQGYFEYGCIPDDIKISIDKKRGYIQPVEGKLIIFPSYLYHQTIPHESNEDRISIAFDLTPKSWKK